MPLVPPKLLGYVLFDYGHRVDTLLVFCSGVHFVMLFEVGNVFGVGEVFFLGVCCRSPPLAYDYYT